MNQARTAAARRLAMHQVQAQGNESRAAGLDARRPPSPLFMPRSAIGQDDHLVIRPFA